MADDKLIGPQPIIGAGDSPDVVGGNAPTTEYAPLNEAANMAIYGYNPATGKAFTPAESAAVSGGYNPYAGAIGYQVDPRTGNLNVLKSDGTVLTTGATYSTSSAGGIVPNLPKNWGAFGYDELGRPINAQGKPYTYEDIRKYNELVATDPAAAKEFAQGKGIAVADGKVITQSDVTNQATGSMVTQSGSSNPFIPGSAAATAWDERKSAYDLLYSQFKQYGLESLITPLQNLITEGVPASEFTIRLRETDAYKKRFAANAERIAKGLTAISEAEYLGLEDQYQNIMRNYGLPDSYYTRDPLGTQEGFNKFIANDVSAAELEDRVLTAQQRVLNANPEVLQSIKDFYGDSITNGDILGYVLNPEKGLADIKRKVTAAEIGGAAVQAGLNLGKTAEEKALYAARAAELGAAGITKQQAQQGFQTVAEVAPRGGQLAAMYGESPYTQQTAEQEVFGLAGSVDAAKQRKKLVGLERAAFSGQTGAAQGALGRERAGVL